MSPSLAVVAEYVKAGGEACVSLTNLFLFILLISKLCKLSKIEIEKSKTMIIITLTIFISLTICFVANSLRLFIYGNDQFHNSITLSLYGISVVLGLVGAMSFYIFMGIQLLTIFKETKFKITKWIIITHGITFILSILFGFGRAFFQIIAHKDLENISGILCLFLLSFGIFHFVWLFNKKLYLITLEQKQHLEALQYSESEIHSELVLLQIIVKVTVLITFNVISTVCLIIIGIVLSIIGGNVSFMIFWIIWTFWAVIASLNIFLVLSPNGNQYKRLCIICDKQCLRLCIWMASKHTNSFSAPETNNNGQRGSQMKPDYVTSQSPTNDTATIIKPASETVV